MIEYLLAFGLTRVEATIYTTLLSHGTMTGYEIAKETGISRSNVYGSLTSLVEKGAAYTLEEDAVKFVPVEINVFLNNTLKDLQKKADYIRNNAPKPFKEETGYITIKGTRHIKDKIAEMLNHTELRLYIMAEKNILEEYRLQLERLVAEKKKVVILSDGFNLKGAKLYKTEPEKGQLRFIVDSSYVLTGELNDGEHDTCLYSGQKNLVSVMKEALKNKIILLEK